MLIDKRDEKEMCGMNVVLSFPSHMKAATTRKDFGFYALDIEGKKNEYT